MSFIYVTFQFKQYTGLEHATVRDNIIYGSLRGWDEERYQAVIEACALTKDLEVFDAGDLTGEFYLTLLLDAVLIRSEQK